MIVLEENSVYSIWREYTLSYNDREVLMWLYCPIVGAEAISLYNMLDTLIGNKNRYDSMFNSDLAKRLAISINELDLNRKKLEAVNLLETYRKEDVSGIKYIYKLLPPATPKKFFSDSNIVLKGLLCKTMGEKYMLSAREHFAIGASISSEYVDVSTSATDVYLIDLDEPYYEMENGYTSFVDKQFKSVESDFDKEVFYEGLKERHVDKAIIDDDLSEILRIGTIYGVKPEKCAELVENSISSNNVFSVENFKNLAMNLVKYGSKKDFIRSNTSGNTESARTLREYENISPADFLGLVSGATPLKSELELIDTLSKEYGFTSGIINFILDYTLTHCDNKLPEKFVLKVAITLKRSNIKTAYDAMATLYRNDKNAKKYINKDAQVTHRQSATNSDLEETSEKENVDVSNLDVLIGDDEL